MNRLTFEAVVDSRFETATPATLSEQVERYRLACAAVGLTAMATTPRPVSFGDEARQWRARITIGLPRRGDRGAAERACNSVRPSRYVVESVA